MRTQGPTELHSHFYRAKMSAATHHRHRYATIYKDTHVSIALQQILGSNKFCCNTLEKISQLLSKLAEENIDISVTDAGLHISKSLFVPYEIMPIDLRTDILDIIDSETPDYADMPQKEESSYIMKYKLAEKHGVAKVGLVRMLCALFLTLKGPAGELADFNGALFDHILQLALNGRQIPYTTVMEELARHGYVPGA